MKLRELKISNYRCIGNKELTIKINNIVVLIGSNNVGKSTVISAYKAFSGVGQPLELEDFHNFNSENPVSMIGVFSEILADDISQIGKKWVFFHPEYGDAIQFKWIWKTPGEKGIKHSWDNESSTWLEGGMGGWDSKISSCLPVPLIISPYESSSSLESKIIEILTNAIKDNIQSDESKLEKLVAEFEKIAQHVHSEIEESFNQTQAFVESHLQTI